MHQREVFARSQTEQGSARMAHELAETSRRDAVLEDHLQIQLPPSIVGVVNGIGTHHNRDDLTIAVEDRSAA